MSAAAITTVASVLAIVNIVGNSLVCAIIKKNRDMRYADNKKQLLDDVSVISGKLNKKKPVLLHIVFKKQRQTHYRTKYTILSAGCQLPPVT